MESVLLLSGLPQRTRAPRPLQLVAVSWHVSLRGVVPPHHGAGAACAETKTYDSFALKAVREINSLFWARALHAVRTKTAPMTSVFEIPLLAPPRLYCITSGRWPLQILTAEPDDHELKKSL